MRHWTDILAEGREPYYRSVGHPVWKLVSVPGHGKLHTEPPDGDDSFPPAVARYEVVDGWLVYHGRNGSIGVIVGTGPELDRWMRDVDRDTTLAPVRKPVPYDPREHGGGRLAAQVVRAAKMAMQVAGATGQVELWHDGGSPRGDASHRSLTIINPTSEETTQVAGVKLRAAEQVAAHEVGHWLYTKDPAAGRRAALALKARKGVSLYHGLTDEFEGLMDAFSVYVLKPDQLRRRRPVVFQIVDRWVKGQ